jgi:hypothetical protein
MDDGEHRVNAVAFAEFAQLRLGAWMRLIGAEVCHKAYGPGGVCAVLVGERGIPRIEVVFDSGAPGVFDADAFRVGAFSTVALPVVLRPAFEDRQRTVALVPAPAGR